MGIYGLLILEINSLFIQLRYYYKNNVILVK